MIYWYRKFYCLLVPVNWGDFSFSFHLYQIYAVDAQAIQVVFRGNHFSLVGTKQLLNVGNMLPGFMQFPFRGLPYNSGFDLATVDIYK